MTIFQQLEPMIVHLLEKLTLDGYPETEPMTESMPRLGQSAVSSSVVQSSVSLGKKTSKQ